MSQSFAYDQETIVLAGSDAVNVFGSNGAVVPATETLLATYTAVGNALLKYVYASGETDGRFKLYVNSTAIWIDRNAWTERNIQSQLEKKLVTGDIVELKVTNLKLTNHFFSGGFYVYKL